MANYLTARQRSVLLRIGEGLRDRNYPPTMREIGLKEGIRSTNGVRCILEALEKKGYITRRRYRSRAVELTPEGKREVMEAMGADPGEEVSGGKAKTVALSDLIDTTSQVVEIPVVGRVAAGVPLLAEENVDGHIAVDRDFAPTGDTFALRVKGQSMIEAGIHDGDVVFCRAQESADNGDIVVALIGDEATVKYYHPETGRVILRPANKYFGPIVVDENTPDFRILGRVVSLFRRY